MTYTNDNHKQLFSNTVRTKWPYKKHTHASVNQMYEMRGRISRKIKLWAGGGRQITWSLLQYKAGRRIAKRVTNGYSRRQIVG
jgi:hypothetical protein